MVGGASEKMTVQRRGSAGGKWFTVATPTRRDLYSMKQP